jgi:hypothetical protein
MTPSSLDAALRSKLNNLTGAAILVSRASTVLQTAPAS